MSLAGMFTRKGMCGSNRPVTLPGWQWSNSPTQLVADERFPVEGVISLVKDGPNYIFKNYRYVGGYLPPAYAGR